METSATSRIFVTGASGFVGENIIDALGQSPVRALVHSENRQLQSRPNVEVVVGDVTDPTSLRSLMDGCDTVIHLVAIIEESGGATFDGVIRQGTENVIAEAKKAGIKRFVHMSALGAQDNPNYRYMQAKWRSELAVISNDFSYTIFRPSVIFGPGDGFINALAGVVSGFPVIPVVGDGTTRFQPVHVSEVAECFARAVADPDNTRGRTFELGGDKIYTYREMLDVIARHLDMSKPKVNVPVQLMRPVVQLSRPLPRAIRPPVTTEQLNMLALDNITYNSSTAELIGREPVALEDRLEYIERS